MSIQLDRQNFVMLYTDREGTVLTAAQTLLEVASVHTSSHGDNADYLITLRETRKCGYLREFNVIYSDFIASKEETMRQLNRNGFIFMPYYSDIFRMYVTDELMKHISLNTLSYFHSGLGFTEMIDGSIQFLLGDSTYQGLPTIYRDLKAEFVQGDEAAYQSFLQTEILPHKTTRFALTLGLCSVLASDLREYADINTIIMNLSGESSTGKTTIAQFMASL